VIRAGLARALKLLVLAIVVPGAVALLIGLVAGTSVSHALALAWYAAGAFVLLVGFAASSRGPTRSSDTGAWAPVSARGRMLRWATRSEQEDSLNVSAVLVALGVVLLVLGVAVDGRHRLF
jgi:uncharacterized membrane protein HdeD (DUF308 family)